MNKVIFAHSGGMPLRQDHFNYMQLAYTKSIEALAGTLQANYKLSGCDVTLVGNTFTCTAGYIVLANEILPVEAHSLTVNFGKSARFVLKTSWDPNGLLQFKPPAGQFNCYQVRYAQLEEYTIVVPEAPTTMPYNAPYAHEVLSGKIFSLEEPWTVVTTFLNNMDNIGGAYASVAYRKAQNGMIMLRGTVNNVDGVAANVLRLPPAYRPSASRVFVVSADHDSAQSAYIVVQPDGYVALRTDVTQFSLDQCCFYP